MTRSYIMNEVFHIETNDETLIEDLLDRLEAHIYEDVEKQEYKKAGERIGSFIEMDENFDQWKMEKGANIR